MFGRFDRRCRFQILLPEQGGHAVDAWAPVLPGPVPGIHVFPSKSKACMAGHATSPATTLGHLRLLLHKAAQIALVGITAVDIALLIHGDAFRRSNLLRRNRNEGGDLSVRNVPDPDSLLEALVGPIVRLRIGAGDHAHLVGRDASGAAEM